MLNAIPNNLDNPLYTEAVYGTRNMNTIAEAVIFSALLPYLSPKNSGIVLEFIIYVNGIAMAVIELKKSSVSVSNGIRQNLTNQKDGFIMQLHGSLHHLDLVTGRQL